MVVQLPERRVQSDGAGESMVEEPVIAQYFQQPGKRLSQAMKEFQEMRLSHPVGIRVSLLGRKP